MGDAIGDLRAALEDVLRDALRVRDLRDVRGDLRDVLGDAIGDLRAGDVRGDLGDALRDALRDDVRGDIRDALCDDLRDEGGKAKAALAASNLSLKSFLASGVSLVTHFCALPSLSARASYSFQRLSAI
jgi:hypothetical protein